MRAVSPLMVTRGLLTEWVVSSVPSDVNRAVTMKSPPSMTGYSNPALAAAGRKSEIAFSASDDERSSLSRRSIPAAKRYAVAAGHVGRPEDAPHLSALVRFIALLQPVALNDDETWSAYATFANLPLHEIKRLLDALARAGVLFRRGQTYRLSPDVLADYLIEDRCVAFDGSSTGYAEQVFDIIDDRLKGQLLINLARLDWRRKNGDVGESRLLDGVWAKLNPSNEPWDPQLDAVADIAFYQPRRCLDFVERKVAEDNITPKLARICKYAAYNLDHLERALELLWELGRDDTTLQNSNTEHAIRILKELTEPEPKKPLAYIEGVVDFGLQLAKEKDAWSHHANPLDFLSGVLCTEGHETEPDRRQLIFRPFFINPEGIRPLRERVLALIFFFSPTQTRQSGRRPPRRFRSP